MALIFFLCGEKTDTEHVRLCYTVVLDLHVTHGRRRGFSGRAALAVTSLLPFTALPPLSSSLSLPRFLSAMSPPDKVLILDAGAQYGKVRRMGDLVFSYSTEREKEEGLGKARAPFSLSSSLLFSFFSSPFSSSLSLSLFLHSASFSLSDGHCAPLSSSFVKRL